MKEDDVLDRLLRIDEALAGLSTQDQLDVLATAWMVTAKIARTEATSQDDFGEEQDRQAVLLERIVLLIKEETPDSELERLCLEGNVTGLLDYVRQRRIEKRQPGL